MDVTDATLQEDDRNEIIGTFGACSLKCRTRSPKITAKILLHAGANQRSCRKLDRTPLISLRIEDFIYLNTVVLALDPHAVDHPD